MTVIAWTVDFKCDYQVIDKIVMIMVLYLEKSSAAEILAE